VVERSDPDRVVGTVELVDLLAGRRRDLAEMRDAERVLVPRVMPRLPRWARPERAGTAA
jgi:hypothetical protein